MKCEYCHRYVQSGETLHGIKYGTEDKEHNVFLPARDSAWILICSACGEKICKLIYSKLNTSINPSMNKTFNRFR